MSEPTLFILGPSKFTIIHRNHNGIPAIYTTNSLRQAEAYLDKLERRHLKNPQEPMTPKRPRKTTLVQWFLKWLWH